MKIIVCLLCFILIGCDDDSPEGIAAANRARLAKVPVQTEGILPTPVEVETPTKIEVPTVEVKMEKIGRIQCPHCGKEIIVRESQ